MTGDPVARDAVSRAALPLLDPVAIDELRASTGDDEEFILDLVETYVAETVAHLAAMRAALVAGDVGSIVRPAHTLKSSSASLGARRMADIGRAIEEAARADVQATLEPDIAAAETTWPATLDALRAAGLAR